MPGILLFIVIYVNDLVAFIFPIFEKNFRIRKRERFEIYLFWHKIIVSTRFLSRRFQDVCDFVCSSKTNHIYTRLFTFEPEKQRILQFIEQCHSFEQKELFRNPPYESSCWKSNIGCSCTDSTLRKSCAAHQYWLRVEKSADRSSYIAFSFFRPPI